MTKTNKIIEELTAAAAWFTEHGTNTNTAIIGICTRAAEYIKYQEKAIAELTDYIIDIENYHEERLEQLQSLTNITFTAE